MRMISDFLNKLASDLLAAEKTVYEPEEVKVYFSAPDKPSTEEIGEEANFQWTRYELIFKRIKYDEEGKPEEIKHYIYKTPLYPWGEEAPGGQEVIDSDPAITRADIAPNEAKRLVKLKDKKILEKPDLYPVGLEGTYINTHKSAPGKEYTYDDFNRKFRKSGFYKVITKTHKLENP